MKEVREHSFEYTVYTSLNQLTAADQKLLYSAIKVAKTAYAPYSDFHVGSAVQLENEEVIVGSNQENAAYPSGLCAERVALFAASANHPEKKMRTLAIYAEKSVEEEEQISPCGACRQVMSEYEQKQNADIRLLLMNGNGKVWEFSSAQQLLPLAFKFNASKI